MRALLLLALVSSGLWGLRATSRSTADRVISSRTKMARRFIRSPGWTRPARRGRTRRLKTQRTRPQSFLTEELPQRNSLFSVTLLRFIAGHDKLLECHAAAQFELILVHEPMKLR